MLIDLNLAGKEVLIVGGGDVSERKASKLVEECSKVIVASKDFTNGLRSLHESSNVELVTLGSKDDIKLLKRLISSAHIVIAATNESKLNKDITRLANKSGVLVCAVDNPLQSDFFFPAVTSFGGIHVAIYTGGKSPAMAKILRERIEGVIKEEDLLQVELQDYVRKLVKSKIYNADARRSILYKIAQDEEVKRLLKKGLFNEAKVVAEKIVERSR